jgi:hypothetical protein
LVVTVGVAIVGLQWLEDEPEQDDDQDQRDE